MNIGDFFWVLMAIWLIFGGWSAYSAQPAGSGTRVYVSGVGGHVLMWLIVFCFGWHFFGFPLHS